MSLPIVLYLAKGAILFFVFAKYSFITIIIALPHVSPYSRKKDASLIVAIT